MKKITDEEICKKLLEDAAPMNLEELGDEKLDELFALEVRGLTHRQWLDADERPIRDFNLLLPYLEEHSLVQIMRLPVGCWVVDLDSENQVEGSAPNLARAAVIALILAARKEKSR